MYDFLFLSSSGISSGESLISLGQWIETGKAMVKKMCEIKLGMLEYMLDRMSKRMFEYMLRTWMVIGACRSPRNGVVLPQDFVSHSDSAGCIESATS